LLKSLNIYLSLYFLIELQIGKSMKKAVQILLIAMGVMAFSSCYETPKPGTGKVVIVDVNDFRVPSATVRLTQPGQLGTGFIVAEGLTDLNGEFVYTHEDPNVDMGLEVILDIDAVYNNAVGQGIIRIKPNETSVEQVKIY